MHELRRILVHDWPIITLVVLTLTGIGLYLEVGPTSLEGAGYRAIDIEAVRKMLDAGELSLHEASWYQRNDATSGRGN